MSTAKASPTDAPAPPSSVDCDVDPDDYSLSDFDALVIDSYGTGIDDHSGNDHPGDDHYGAPSSDTLALRKHFGSLRVVAPATTMLRPAAAVAAAAHLLRPSAQVVAWCAPSGSGRSTALGEVAAVLWESGDGRVLRNFRGDKEELSTAATRLVERARRRKDIVVIDDLDQQTGLGPNSGSAEFLNLIAVLNANLDVRFLVVVDESAMTRIAEHSHRLAARLTRIDVPPLPTQVLPELVGTAAQALATEHRLGLGDGVVAAALAPARAADRRAHPGLALDRIDAAIGQAMVTGAETLEATHLALAGAPAAELTRPLTAAALHDRLGAAVRGQDRAVHAVARSVAAPLRGLRLRPERPLAVLLLVGPTGVGKTELAKQLAHEVFGSTDAMIRLDMSEYASEQDGRAKLIGHHRSWKNSTTEGLLTTKILHTPRCVVLLDEFEKSAPELWPIFLQVFDEGRLTDGWGQTASFRETIIVLTSNAGVREGSARTTGFGATGGFQADRQHAALTALFPPEFLARITEIINFDALGIEAIREIAALELARATATFAEDGWQISYDEAVAAHLAERGYDPARGARHLQQTIETELLGRLADAASRHVRITVDRGELQLIPNSHMTDNQAPDNQVPDDNSTDNSCPSH